MRFYAFVSRIFTSASRIEVRDGMIKKGKKKEKEKRKGEEKKRTKSIVKRMLSPRKRGDFSVLRLSDRQPFIVGVVEALLWKGPIRTSDLSLSR